MAVLYDTIKSGRRYQVRNAGKSIRLYTDGIFHSQWNPNYPLSGNLWDLLLLPAFLVRQPLTRAAILGVGGGAVINQLNHFFNPERVIGVDFDHLHLQLARRFFRVRDANTQLVCARAEHWLKQQLIDSGRFDYLVEDLFVGQPAVGSQNSEARRAIVADYNWMTALYSLLRDSGVLVMNFESHRQLRDTVRVCQLKRSKNDLFPTIFALSNDRYSNVIGVFCRRAIRVQSLRAEILRNLRQNATLSKSQRAKVFNFRLRKLR